MADMQALFAEGQSTIQTKRNAALFDELRTRELTQDEQAIVDQRVAHNKRMLELYEKQERKRKVEAVREVFAMLTEEEAMEAVRLSGDDEEEAVRRLTEDTGFMRRVHYAAAAAADPQAPRRLDPAGNAAPRRPKNFKADGVFIGGFRGKITGGLPAAKLPAKTSSGDGAADAKAAPDPADGGDEAAAAEAPPPPPAEAAPEPPAEEAKPKTPRRVKQPSGPAGEAPTPVSPGTELTMKDAAAKALVGAGKDGMRVDAIVEAVQAKGIADWSNKRTPKASLSAVLNGDARFVRVGAATYALKDEAGDDATAAAAPSQPPAPPAPQDAPPPPPSPEAGGAPPPPPVADAAPPSNGKRPRRARATSAVLAEADAGDDDTDGATDEEMPAQRKRKATKATRAPAAKRGGKGKGKAAVAKASEAAGEAAPPAAEEAAPPAAPPKDDALPESGEGTSSPPAGAGARAPAVEPGSGGVVRKTHYGRVKKGSTKSCEIVSIGKLVDRKGWHNNGYIFTDGFHTRTAFRSSVEPSMLCVHECTIFDKGKFAPKPTFRVVAMDRPDEPLDAQSATGCWTGILKRISNGILERIAKGEDLPRPPKTAIAGPEYFGLNHPEAQAGIEALDTGFTCTEYWKGRDVRSAIMAGAAFTGGKVSHPRQGGEPRSRKPKKARRDMSSDEEEEEDDDDAEAAAGTNRWAGVNRAARYRERYGGGVDDDSNPLPNHIDPITLEAVDNPAMSPAGHVMGLATWKAVLAEKGHCPFTKEPLAVHSLIKLTKGNIDKYRHLIIAT